MIGSNASFVTRSILFNTRMTGFFVFSSRSMMKRSPGPGFSVTSTTKKMASTSFSVFVMERSMYSPSFDSGLWTPGVSSRMTCASGCVRMQSMRVRVVCGLSDMMAIFCPIS